MAQISDHAVLRYLERAYGLDIDAVRAQMQSPALDAAVKFGGRVVKLGNGCRLLLRNDVVTTVLEPRMLPYRPDGREMGE